MKLFAVGYSLGANVLGKYIGEEGEKCILKAACCINSPLDLLEFTKSIKNTNFGFFSRFLANSIK